MKSLYGTNRRRVTMDMMGINKGLKVDGWQKKDMAQRYLIRAGGTPIKWTSGEPGFWNARKYAHGPRDEGCKQSVDVR